MSTTDNNPGLLSKVATAGNGSATVWVVLAALVAPHVALAGQVVADRFTAAPGSSERVIGRFTLGAALGVRAVGASGA